MDTVEIFLETKQGPVIKTKISDKAIFIEKNIYLTYISLELVIKKKRRSMKKNKRESRKKEK